MNGSIQNSYALTNGHNGQNHHQNGHRAQGRQGTPEDSDAMSDVLSVSSTVEQIQSKQDSLEKAFGQLIVLVNHNVVAIQNLLTTVQHLLATSNSIQMGEIDQVKQDLQSVKQEHGNLQQDLKSAKKEHGKLRHAFNKVMGDIKTEDTAASNNYVDKLDGKINRCNSNNTEMAKELKKQGDDLKEDRDQLALEAKKGKIICGIIVALVLFQISNKWYIQLPLALICLAGSCMVYYEMTLQDLGAKVFGEE